MIGKQQQGGKGLKNFVTEYPGLFTWSQDEVPLGEVKAIVAGGGGVGGGGAGGGGASGGSEPTANALYKWVAPASLSAHCTHSVAPSDTHLLLTPSASYVCLVLPFQLHQESTWPEAASCQTERLLQELLS